MRIENLKHQVENKGRNNGVTYKTELVINRHHTCLYFAL